MSSTGQGIAQKVQLRFSKTGALRFLSHHDVMRLFARACRRAGLPLRLTQGFDPRPRMVFATALELGIESHSEAVDLELSRWVPPQKVRAEIASALPEGMEITAAKLLPPKRSGERPVEMSYRVLPPGSPATQGITPARIREFLAREQLLFERPREKRIQRLDLRPSLLDLELDAREGSLAIRLRPTQHGTARPAEILSLLSEKPLTETRSWPTTKTAMQMAP